MLVRGLRRDGAGGYQVRPGEVADVPDAWAKDLIDVGSAEPATGGRAKQLNWDPAGPLANLPAGSRLLVKLP